MRNTRTYVVYMCTNTTNGKSYVGITRKSLARRRAEHLSSASSTRHSCRAFHAAIASHGADKFQWTTLAENVAEDAVDDAEMRFIALHDTFGPNGYNLTRGGRLAKNSVANPFDDPEIRRRRRETCGTDAYRSKMSTQWRKYWSLPSARERQSMAMRSRWKDERYKEKTANNIRTAIQNSGHDHGNHSARIWREAGVEKRVDWCSKIATSLERPVQGRASDNDVWTTFRSSKEAASMTGRSSASISRCVSGKQAKSGGWEFRRA